MKTQGNPITILDDRLIFPPVEYANQEGILAVGGDLSKERLILAYENGIFPWFNDDSFILWWSPDPRMVLYPEKIRISKSMRNIISHGKYKVTRNKAFKQVMLHCANINRPGQVGTWITQNMMEAYTKLYNDGVARSYEVWEGTELVGGLYGLDLKHVFCGESMFSLKSNTSKLALIHLAQELASKNYVLIDCQQHTAHLERLGAELISREAYLEVLKQASN